jgi:hypothetical protein
LIENILDLARRESGASPAATAAADPARATEPKSE